MVNPTEQLDMTFSQSPTIFGVSNVTKVYLKIEDKPPEGLPNVLGQKQGKLQAYSEQPHLIELHPVFAHINLLLMETLAITQHGDFTARSKQGKYQTIVELGGHVSQRYCLTRDELKRVQQIYDQILEAWIGWRLYQREPRE